MSENDWSEWLDHNQEMLSKIPETSGVYMMHAAMKILHIGGSENMKKSVTDTLSNGCVSKATRFRFRKEEDFEKIKNELIKDFKKRHEGQGPTCMN